MLLRHPVYIRFAAISGIESLQTVYPSLSLAGAVELPRLPRPPPADAPARLGRQRGPFATQHAQPGRRPAAL